VGNGVVSNLCPVSVLRSNMCPLTCLEGLRVELAAPRRSLSPFKRVTGHFKRDHPGAQMGLKPSGRVLGPCLGDPVGL
jgi:hypothetical protein